MQLQQELQPLYQFDAPPVQRIVPSAPIDSQLNIQNIFDQQDINSIDQIKQNKARQQIQQQQIYQFDAPSIQRIVPSAPIDSQLNIQNIFDQQDINSIDQIKQNKARQQIQQQQIYQFDAPSIQRIVPSAPIDSQSYVQNIYDQQDINSIDQIKLNQFGQQQQIYQFDTPPIQRIVPSAPIDSQPYILGITIQENLQSFDKTKQNQIQDQQYPIQKLSHQSTSNHSIQTDIPSNVPPDQLHIQVSNEIMNQNKQNSIPSSSQHSKQNPHQQQSPKPPEINIQIQIGNNQFEEQNGIEKEKDNKVEKQKEKQNENTNQKQKDNKQHKHHDKSHHHHQHHHKDKEKEKQIDQQNNDDLNDKIPCEICNQIIQFSIYQQHIDQHRKNGDIEQNEQDTDN